MMVLLGAWSETGCSRHVVVERDEVQTLNQENWTIHSAPDSAGADDEATPKREIETDATP